MHRIQTQKHTPTIHSKCPFCQTPIQFNTELLGIVIELQCFSCSKVSFLRLPSILDSRSIHTLEAYTTNPDSTPPNSNPNTPNNSSTTPTTQSKDLYTLLNLSFSQNPTPAEIKNAYIQIAKSHHPDKYIGPHPVENEAYFKEVTRAYGVLSDDDLRGRYDQVYYLSQSQGQSLGGFAGGVGGGGLGGFGGGDVYSYFRDIFGGEYFEVWIGELEIAREFSSLFEQLNTNTTATTNTSNNNTPTNNMMNKEEKEKRHQKRVEYLLGNLDSFLQELVDDDSLWYSIYSSSDPSLPSNTDSSSQPQQQQSSSSYSQSYVPGQRPPPLTTQQLSNLKEMLLNEEGRLYKKIRDLKYISYGSQILHSLGHQYQYHARQFLNREENQGNMFSIVGIFGGYNVVGVVGGMWNGMKERVSVVKDGISVVGSVVSLQKAIKKLEELNHQSSEEQSQQSQLGKEGGSSDTKGSGSSSTGGSGNAGSNREEEKKYWEERVKYFGMKALWNSIKLELESTLQEVLSLYLNSPTTPNTTTTNTTTTMVKHPKPSLMNHSFTKIREYVTAEELEQIEVYWRQFEKRRRRAYLLLLLGEIFESEGRLGGDGQGDQEKE